MGYLIFWGIVFVLALILEMLSMQLTSIWFAVGAAGAFAAAFFGIGIIGQLAIFVLVSLILLLATRPLLAKLRVKHAPPMNADKDIGGTAVIIETVDALHGTGRARINGVDWIAVSLNGDILPEKTVVSVVAVDGAKLVVTQQSNI